MLAHKELSKVEKVLFHKRVLLPPVHLNWEFRPLLAFVGSSHSSHLQLHTHSSQCPLVFFVHVNIITFISKRNGIDFATILSGIRRVGKSNFCLNYTSSIADDIVVQCTMYKWYNTFKTKQFSKTLFSAFDLRGTEWRRASG